MKVCRITIIINFIYIWDVIFFWIENIEIFAGSIGKTQANYTNIVSWIKKA